jgi:hypothetical protein
MSTLRDVPIVLGWRYCRRSQSDGRRRCIIHSLSSQRDNEYRLAARRDAGALALPAHGVHAVRNGRCRRSARLGTARQQAPRMSSRRPFPRPLPPGFIAPCLPTASDRCKSGPDARDQARWLPRDRPAHRRSGPAIHSSRIQIGRTATLEKRAFGGGLFIAGAAELPIMTSFLLWAF